MSIQSHTYRSRLKRFTELVKSYHPTLRRIPAALPRVGSDANKLAKKLTAKQVTARKEEFGRIDSARLNRQDVAYWLSPWEETDYRTRKAS